MSAKTQHQRYRLHSQLNSSVIRNYAKLSAKEPMLININEAKKKTSQLATWREDLTFYLARLLLIIPEHVIAICEGAWHGPEVLSKRAFASMAASMS